MLSKRRYYTENLKIDLPIILSFAGQSVVQMLDTIMVGQLGKNELGAVAFAGTVIINVMVVGIGISISLTPLTGQAFATGSFKKAAGFFQNSLMLNSYMGVILTGILLLLFPFLKYMGQPEEVMQHVGGYYVITAISLIPLIMFLSFKQFMEGIGNTKVAMIITITCNVVNVILNYILIYGKFGAPALGVEGAAIATLIARTIMPIAFFLYMYRYYPFKRFFAFFKKENLSFKLQMHLFKIGSPIAGQMVLECLCLSLITIMMGWLGAVALAANQIVMSIISFAFMISNGIVGASTILVSQSLGRRNYFDIKHYARASFHMSIAFMAVAGILFALFGRYIAMIFTPDQEVVLLAAKLFLLCAFFEVIDGLQITALGALRGLVDVNKPMIYALIAYIFITLPVSYVLGFVLSLGPVGIILGLTIGLFIACVLFLRRFKYKIGLMESGTK